MTYPDPNTKLKSQNELMELMGARDSRGQKLYEVDPYYRRCVEQKIANGYELNNPGPEIRGKFEEPYVVTGADWENASEVARLSKELNSLTQYAEHVERQEIVAESKNPMDGAAAREVKPISKEEMMRAMGTPEYRNNESYRKHIEERVKVTSPDSLNLKLRTRNDQSQ